MLSHAWLVNSKPMGISYPAYKYKDVRPEVQGAPAGRMERARALAAVSGAVRRRRPDRAGGEDLLPGAPVMAAYLVRRIGYGLVTVLGVLFLLFVLFFAVTDPDDIARKAVGERARPEVYAQWKKNHGYDKPLFLNTQASGAEPLHRHAAVRALSPHAHLRFRPQRRRRQPDLQPPAGRGGPEPQPDGAAVRARPRAERGRGAVRRLLPRDLRRPPDARACAC